MSKYELRPHLVVLSEEKKVKYSNWDPVYLTAQVKNPGRKAP